MSDLISREDAIKCCWKPIVKPNGEIFVALKMAIQSEIEALPSVEPERKKGKWLLKIEDWIRWTCSECGFSKRTDIHVTLGYDYCPKCGAKMEVDG